MGTVTVQSVGDLATLIRSPALAARREQVQEDHRTYSEAANQLLWFLRESGMPTEVAKIGREHVESFIERLVATKSPATANNRYRAFTALFAFLVDFGEITDSPMAKMKPPKVPEVPVPVPTDAQLKRLLATCQGSKLLEDQRDYAVKSLSPTRGCASASSPTSRWRTSTSTGGWPSPSAKGAARGPAPSAPRPPAPSTATCTAGPAHPSPQAPMRSGSGQRGGLTTAGIRSIVERRAKQAGIGHVHAHLFRHNFADTHLPTAGTKPTSCASSAGVPVRWSAATPPAPQASAPVTRTAVPSTSCDGWARNGCR